MHDVTNRPLVGRPRATDVEQRDLALLEVAERAFIEEGYERATLQIIVQRARVSKKTIYAKYGGKPGLLRAVLARMADKHMGADLRFLERDDPAEGLYEWARMILRINQSREARAITAISMREGGRVPEFTQAMVDAGVERQQGPLRAYLERLQERGAIRPVDCAELASTFLWILSRDMVLSVSAGTDSFTSDSDIDAKARWVAELFALGVLHREHRFAR